MGKKVADSVLDAALDYLANNADQIIACEGEPASYADATTLKGSGGNKLGDEPVGAGDFTKADGDTSGRKVTVAGQNIDIDESGDADHLALVDDAASEILHVTTMTSAVSVASGGVLPTADYDEELEDPA